MTKKSVPKALSSGLLLQKKRSHAPERAQEMSRVTSNSAAINLFLYLLSAYRESISRMKMRRMMNLE